MNLVKSSFFTSISGALQVIVGFIINKMVAVFIGSVGLVLIGQFQNFSQLTQSLANGDITQIIVKYVAECRGDLLQKQKILSAALIISTGFSLFIDVYCICYTCSINSAVYS